MTDELAEYDELVALRDLIEADPRLAGRVGIGSAIVPGHEADDEPPLLSTPYVVLYGAAEYGVADTLTGSAEWNRDPGVTLHAVGDSDLAAVAILGWVDGLLRPNGVGVTPAVPGRQTGRIRRTERPGNITDDDGPRVVSAVAVYRFGSRRTATT